MFGKLEQRARWTWRRLIEEYPRLAAVRGRMIQASVAGSESGTVEPENMIWIFGSGRSGSTWLRTMMSEMDRHRYWEEPMVGELFGGFYDKAQKGQLGSPAFIMGNPTRDKWVKSLRRFVLDGAGYANPRLKSDEYLIIKEPNGSAGAPLLMEALPESRMIFLVRDPRDVVASSLDAAREGSWLYAYKDKGGWKQNSLADNRPDVFVKRRAERYLQHAGGAKRAYEAHQGPKVLVRYERLRTEPLKEMKRVYSELQIPFEEGEFKKTVEKHSWENIPEDQKGEGKFYRKGSPGSWRKDLTPEQVQIVEKTTAPLLSAYYSE